MECLQALNDCQRRDFFLALEHTNCRRQSRSIPDDQYGSSRKCEQDKRPNRKKGQARILAHLILDHDSVYADETRRGETFHDLITPFNKFAGLNTVIGPSD